MGNGMADFAEIYADNYSKVFAFIYNIANEQSLAEDITQEAFMKAYKNIGAFRGESKISVWLNRIAYNIFVDHKRKKSTVQTSLDDNPLALKLADMRKNIAKEIEQKLMSECVQSKVDRLPEQYRGPLFLDVHGYTNQEIASILECSLDNAKIRLHRARKKMKEILGEDCNFYYDERNVLC